MIVNGEEWYEIRSKCQQDMMRPSSALFYVDKIQSLAKELVAFIDRKKDANHYFPGEFVNNLHAFAFESTVQFALDYKLGIFRENPNQEAKRLVDINTKISDNFHSLALGVPFYEYLPNPR